MIANIKSSARSSVFASLTPSWIVVVRRRLCYYRASFFSDKMTLLTTNRVLLMGLLVSSATLLNAAPAQNGFHLAADTHTTLGAKPVTGNANVAGLDFANARDLLHERSDSLRAASAAIAHSQYEADATKALNGPKVDMTAMQVWGTKTVSMGFDTGLGALASNPLPGPIGQLLQKFDHIDIGFKEDIGGPRAALNMVWPIYTGGAISAKQSAAQYKVSQTRAQRDASVNTMDAQFAGQYWGVQLARSVEVLRQDTLSDLEEQVRKARRYEAQGLISKIERMAVEVHRDAARRDLIAAQTDTRIAESQLMSSLKVTSLPALSSPLFVIRGNIGTLDEWKDQALRSSPVLSQINAIRAQAGEGVKAAKSAFQPQIFAFGQKNLIKHYLTLPEPDWMAGIGVKFTLWDNTDRFSKLHSANALVSQADASHADAVNSLTNAVEVAWLRVTQLRQEYELSHSTVSLARENLQLRETSFAEGLSTANEVNEARTSLVGAQIAERVASFKFIVAWATLNATSGTMAQFVESLNRTDIEIAQ